MADLSITAKYNSANARVCFWVCMVLAPLWAVLSLVAATVFTLLILMGMPPFYSIFFHQISGIEPVISIDRFLRLAGPALAFWFITASGAAISLLFADNRIIASENGLRLPMFLSLGTKFKNHIPWDKITSMEIIGDPSKGLEGLLLRLVAADMGAVRMKLRNLESQDLEKILQSADVWLMPSAKGPLLESVREKLASLPLLGRDRSQKRAYEEELDTRFTATAFVPLEPGEELQKGTLKVVRQLSFGGLSAIYLVQEKQSKLYVLKESVVPEETKPTLKQKAWELFRREADLLSRLDHPHIVKVIKSFEEKEREYLLLEYLSGLNLRQLVRESGILDESEVIEITLSLAETIAYLHSFVPSVVHRDITPENIIMGSDNQPILIDFGVANEFIGTATGTLVGKHCYISPEQFRGKATTASDLYSLGCTMHFLLTGKDPVPLMQSSPRQLNENVSLELDGIVAALTNLEQGERLASASQLIERLQELFNSDQSLDRSGAHAGAPAAN